MAVDGPGIAAIIVGSATGVSIIIGALRVQAGAKKKSDAADDAKPAAKPVEHTLPPVPEQFDPAEVLDYLRQIREDLNEARRRLDDKDVEIAGLKRQMIDMGDELKLRNRVQEAFSRYLLIIYRGWGKTDSPPLPEGNDLVLLQDFIPRT